MPIEGYKLKPINGLIASLIAVYGEGMWQIMSHPMYRVRKGKMLLNLTTPCGRKQFWIPMSATTQVYPAH